MSLRLSRPAMGGKAVTLESCHPDTMFVYILKSEVTGKFYAGITQNIEDRLSRHNNGQSKATKAGAPWGLVKVFQADNRSLAMKLERKIEKRGIQRFLANDHKTVAF